ncbi:outer membrane lipoprotein carrier protein LolA [Rhodocytophaga aerolata]|uniref:Outer membrane lipoprotein carrier protein LolA n=1 Tax=Rhodocytophaga aerolata TaxID=455078 RepID=A0ABT8R4Q9_9BACT|nr:outer membrane lipoprotein carrier protein LolA [Rhodocytophaga aerolata]MDO1447091.1 outer membrane lipoprotein carrier protein LolA [Rhodocytophaga aerolata]
MKRINLLLAFVFLCTGALMAQKDKRAEEILDAMSDKYKAFHAFKAQFTYTMESPSAGVNETYNGDLTVKGPKYYMNLGEQEIINNGSTVWTYIKETNEVNISDYEPDEDEITPSKIFSIYKKGYKYNFVEEKKEGGQVYEIVDLIPEDKNKNIFKVRITVNKKDRSMKSLRVFEKSGNRYVYTVNRFTPVETIDDNFFAFDKSKYKGVEIIDLR